MVGERPFSTTSADNYTLPRLCPRAANQVASFFDVKLFFSIMGVMGHQSEELLGFAGCVLAPIMSEALSTKHRVNKDFHLISPK